MECYFTSQKKDNSFVLALDDSKHITTVLRHKIGDEIVVIYEQQKYLTTITSLQPQVRCEIKHPLAHSNSELVTSITLVMALLKEQKFDFVIQKAVELGVSTIVPLQLQRCVSVLTASKAAQKVMRWQNIAKAAAKQANRNIIPQVTPVVFSLAQLKKYQSQFNFVADAHDSNTKWTKIFTNNIASITLVVGPEGGITKNEITTLNSLGFSSISLGPLILRAETAPLFLITIINYETNLKSRENNND